MRRSSASARGTPIRYVMQRAQSCRCAPRPVRAVFTQFEDARPFGKDYVTPVDKIRSTSTGVCRDRQPLGPGTVKFRIGRQEMAFDLQRFISVRDGPNVRQAFDAIWADYETAVALHRLSTQPVQYRD